jgi:hypothetical protein
VLFPGGGEPLDRQFQGARLLGERQPGEVPVTAVGARRAARQHGDAVPGRRQGESVRAGGRQLGPQRQPGLRRLGPPGGQLPGQQRGQQVAALGEGRTVCGQPGGVDGTEQLGRDRLAEHSGTQVERGLAGDNGGPHRLAGPDPADPQAAPQHLGD